MSVFRAQREISSKEFAEWMAYDRIEPGEPHRSDWRSAMLAWVISQAMSSKRTRTKISDFLPKFENNIGSEETKDWRSIKQRMLSWATKVNRQDAKMKKREQKKDK